MPCALTLPGVTLRTRQISGVGFGVGFGFGFGVGVVVGGVTGAVTSVDAHSVLFAPFVSLPLPVAVAQFTYVPVCVTPGWEVLPCARVLVALRPIMEDESVWMVGQNLMEDLLVMRQAGVNVRGVEMDWMIAAFLLDAIRMLYGIDRLALHRIVLDADAILAPGVADSGKAAGRPWIARALVAGGHVPNIAEAFNRRLARGRLAFVPRQGASTRPRCR